MDISLYRQTNRTKKRKVPVVTVRKDKSESENLSLPDIRFVPEPFFVFLSRRREDRFLLVAGV
ncbi:MAG: hypothetical protein LBT46_05000 [Planctomycetaceae bacterium]|jgi:hypothetical protein|nr:hypothetical protein [Planctomycetaceae bacterium]